MNARANDDLGFAETGGLGQLRIEPETERILCDQLAYWQSVEADFLEGRGYRHTVGPTEVRMYIAVTLGQIQRLTG